MEKALVEERLTEVFREMFVQPLLKLSDELTAADVEGWDSISHVDLIVAVESEFHIKLTTSQVRGLRNVGEFVKIIALKAK